MYKGFDVVVIIIHIRFQSVTLSGVVLKNEVGERLEIEVGYCSKKCNLARILHSVSAAIFETVE